MPIIKIRQPGGFAQIANSTLRDKRLSLDTRGYLCELLSHTEDLEVSIDWLTKHFGVGRDKLFRMNKELKEAGYLETPAVTNEKGQFEGKDWFIYGVPPDIRKTGEPEVGEKPTTGKPDYILKREDQEREEEDTSLRDVAGPEKPDETEETRVKLARKKFWEEFLALLTAEMYVPEEQAKKMLGKLFQKYDRDYVAGVYEENRELIREASDPYPYFLKILSEEKGKTPEDREAEKQLRQAQLFHRRIYANLEYCPNFLPENYLARFPLIERFIEKSAGGVG